MYIKSYNNQTAARVSHVTLSHTEAPAVGKWHCLAAHYQAAVPCFPPLLVNFEALSSSLFWRLGDTPTHMDLQYG